MISLNLNTAFCFGKTESKAVNVIKFKARGLSLLNGKLTIEASLKIGSKLRVDINYDNSTITPDQTRESGFSFTWFEHCRYVDDTMRIGRDDKGNILILERSEEYTVYTSIY
ncbi:hypothetical protein CRYUN_Cryun22dG0060500 [Craigia yunnanensis]